ncbi:hypothetical protein C1H46_027758 [Malus baccata]|uniref:non-specific serine/threonine protein kinase n=1 Tax=Malus baccata TaxID=106549 RepID=A0A540LJT5_MALBA|nr:hypothetical protein C1H46_027758 [Malus baccata]
MSKPSLRLQLTKLVLYHILLWQLGRWPQSKFHCRADVARLPPDEVSALRLITRDLEFKDQPTITDTSCDGIALYDFTINCTCDGNQCNITEITIRNLDLTGTIHEAVGYLSNLQTLILSDNKLHGSIPDILGNLVRLETLDLSKNQLSGLIPASLGGLYSLQYLYLQYNLLTGGIPRNFGSLTDLIELDLQFNMLSGSIPESFGDLSKLTTMDLSENQLSGPLPESLGKLKSLTSFYVSANYLSGKFPEGYDKLTSLEEFEIDGNYISGPLPVETIAKWTSIYYLRISDLAINDSFRLPEKIANSANFISLRLRNCSITGPIPKYISEEMTSLSYLNLFACCRNSSTSLPYMMDPIEMKNTYCPRNKPKYHSLFINCGGEETTVGGNIYDQDNDTSLFYTSPKKNWAYSLSGDYGVIKSNSSDYIKSTTRGVSITEAPLYEKARLSPVSLKYYAFCLRNGRYNVTLHFHEIIYTDNADYTSLKKRAFDVYIQGNRTLNYFNIRDKEGIGEKPITESYSAEVVSDLLEIRFYWPGKGTHNDPPTFNGPLISAISVNPEFEISPHKYKRLRIALITIASFIAALLLLLAVGWRMGWLPIKEEPKIKIGQEKKDDELKDKLVTVKELINATGNFSDKKTLGRSGTVYKAELQGHIVAVKKLDHAQFNEKTEGLNKEIGTIRSLQHNNILELLDVYIDKDLLLLVYEYMESLADILFDSSTSSTVKLDWNTRVKICLGIAKGLDHLHEHPRVKILHMNIKSANILLNENFEAKISDFGFASFYTNEEKVKVITREVSQGYMAPEYFQTNVLTSKADVYSFGVVVLEIVSGKRNILSKSSEETQVLLDRAYQALAERNLKSLVDKSLSKYDEKEALVILTLAVHCTTLGPSVRPTMSEVVSVLVREKTLDEVFPHAKLTGDGNVAGSTFSGKTSAASTSSNDHGKVFLD